MLSGSPVAQSQHNSPYPESAGRRTTRARLLAATALLAASIPARVPAPATQDTHRSGALVDPAVTRDGRAQKPEAVVADQRPAAPPDTCVASWYGEAHRGRPTASGAPFDPDALTAATWTHDFGTRLAVTAGAHTVVVTVNDRGPARVLNRCVDLSAAAFARLADLDVGLIDVTVEEVGP
jgi:rare lipoprotein A